MSFSNPVAALPNILGPRTTTALAALSVYIVACRGLRYLRRDKKHAEYPYKTQEDLSKMTAEHAWEISKYVMTLEFPFMSEKALQFALFRTYGIPTISKLLCDTKQFADPDVAPRRFADTALLITEFLGQSPTSDRANSAIARMNYLHGMYQRAGKISNDDMLYTLSLFVLEVERWIGLYEWRSLTDMEMCALGTLWKSIGDAMSISWAPLSHGPSSFHSGLQFFHDLRVWSTTYEELAMLPAATNHQLAEQTTKMLLYDVPTPFKPAAKQVVAALMDDRLRESMLCPKPAAIYPALVSVIFIARRIFCTYLLPPRPEFLRFNMSSEEADPKTGRYYAKTYYAEPWYVQPTFWTRNSPKAWLRWATGKAYPDGKKFKPEGYHILEMGPQKYETKGMQECEETRVKLMAERRGGCPFA